ncbi:hypothetical protein C7S18_22210 [Ahniella affigens]|uniref:Uncharacterized protein n=1 Tax=Ahniella affigens TaxID=2021234 RepID=A0A2P1PXZ2_9GAMM|nr:hypothetical protein [Ahniella affigens]AVP99721.1 hypothetical protein C7S18_22210 [Ahniella affigens]
MTTSPFQALKLWIMHASGLSRDALHVYVGLLVFFVACGVFRKHQRSLWPLLLVVVVACLGELLDMRDDLRMVGSWRWQASLHDVLNTCFWPSVISVLIRLRLPPWSRS